MFVTKEYDRAHAVEYARKYAFSQNPLFGDFREIGGNCTNFVSQCVYAGSCRMNFTPIVGWYYLDLSQRTASWTGVDYFFDFVVGNRGVGPFGRETGQGACEIGDVIQLSRAGVGYYHSLLIVGFDAEMPLVAAQTEDSLDRRLDSYTYDVARFLHIDGVRLSIETVGDCYDALVGGVALFPDGQSPKE